MAHRGARRAQRAWRGVKSKREHFALWRTGVQEELSAVGVKRLGTKRRSAVGAERLGTERLSASDGEWGR